MSDYFMGTDGFVWFVGVVEDRHDPEYMGRVRVRCLGFHTESLDLLPTADLPWATVMAPTTNPSMSGLGSTPPFLVEGSWVVGFFRDSREKQQPVILGSLPGFNAEEPDFTDGFADPNGVYPTITGEPDTNRLAQGAAQEFHPSLYKRQKMKQTKVPIATKPALTTFPGSMYNDHGGDDTDPLNPTPKIEKRTTWDEPDPKSAGVTEYPYNHVHESESGHVIEIDDTPGNERLHTYHNSGTFEEIHPDGSKVTKVVKDNYEIIAGDNNIFIGKRTETRNAGTLEEYTETVGGNLNITIEGSVRQLVKGDYHLEVEGDYSQKIHKNFYSKIGARGLDSGGGNLEEEITGNHAYNIEGNQNGRINKDVDTVINGKESRIIGKQSDLFVTGDNDTESKTYKKGYTVSTDQRMLYISMEDFAIITTSGIVAIQSADKLNLKSASDMTIKSETKITETAITTINTTAGTVYTIQSGGGSPTATNKVDINP